MPEPGALANFWHLFGFLGRSGLPRVWRCYLTSDLRSWVDIKEDDIIHAQQLDPEQSPKGDTEVCGLGPQLLITIPNANLMRLP
jgi:hypothetical protein